MPSACNPPFDWLQAQNLISDAALEQRTRKALAAGNANLAAALVKRLPAPRAAPLQQWLRLLQDPKSALAGIAADPRQNFEWAALNAGRSEEHTSELQSLMRISYAVFCLKK